MVCVRMNATEGLGSIPPLPGVCITCRCAPCRLLRFQDAMSEAEAEVPASEAQYRAVMCACTVRRSRCFWWRRAWENVPVFDAWRKRRNGYLCKKWCREAALSFLKKAPTGLVSRKTISRATRSAGDAREVAAGGMTEECQNWAKCFSGGLCSPVFSPQFCQQRLGFLEVRRVEPFGEPVVDWRQQRMGFLALALALPEATQAHGGAQLQGFCLLVAGHGEGLMKAGLRLDLI